MLADPCTGARGRDFLLGRHRGQLVRAHVPSWCSGHGVDAGCSQQAGPPGQLTTHSYQTPAEGTGKTRPVRARAFSWSWDKRARRPAMSPLGTECFDIFSPLPGAREVMIQVERLSSRETKIALRSVRTAACS